MEHPGSGARRRRLSCARVTVALTGALALVPAAAQWVRFVDQTESRIVADPARVAADVEEKAYAWGDVDRDGDLDLVVVRKQPNTTPGGRVNVLLVNEGGVLTDRTGEFAVDSSVPGDLGFDTPTNDRDVVLVDVDLDGWLDVVTAVDLSPGAPQHVGYPRVYVNQCCATGGCGATSCATDDWLGWRYEFDRIPAMLTDSGQTGFNPCFTAVAAGDVTGDGYPDLYFGDHNSACTQPGADFNDKLLINQGPSSPGFFSDETETSFVGAATGFPVSGFVGGVGIGKFNADDRDDILRQDQGSVRIAYNSSTRGVFDQVTAPYGGNAYHASHGDLNNDGLLDVVVTDDGNDRYLLHQGDPGNGLASFMAFIYSFSHSGTGGPPSDEGFGGNSVIADLDGDGWNDVLITDVDLDLVGCTRRMHVYRNLGGSPGDNVVLVEETTGAGCASSAGNPPTCIVVGIPSDRLEGTHDVAVFDIDGDARLDLVVGRCTGTEVYLNLPPPPPSGAVADGQRFPGSPLLLSRSGSMLTLTWGDSCSNTDTDYTVYQGKLGVFDSHEPLTCSTAGATSLTLEIGAPDAPPGYFLVAPRNDEVLGSLGTASNGLPRGPGPAPCLPQVVEACR